MYPTAYLDYLVHFHVHRDYFECHEVLEEFWKEGNSEEIIWVGLIQVAVALYHQRRGNIRGATKMMSSALRILEANPNKLTQLGLHADPLLALLRERLLDIKRGASYSSFDLPLTEDLIQHLNAHCLQHQLEWCSNKDISDHFVLNKHTLRDRSEVVQEREASKQKKKPPQS